MTEKDLALLLRRYYEGATSPAEEAALRRYFRRPEADVPPRWRGEQAYFRALDAARPAAVPPELGRRIGELLDWLAESEAPAAPSPAGEEPDAPRASQNMLRRIRLRRALWAGGAAACLVLALAFGWQRFGQRTQPAEPPVARAVLPYRSPLPAAESSSSASPGIRPPTRGAQPASPSSPAAPACEPRPAAEPASRPTPEELAQVRRGLQLYAEALRTYRESLAAIDRQVRHTEAELQASVRQARALCATAREGHRGLLGRCMESGQETHRKLQEIIQQLNP